MLIRCLQNQICAVPLRQMSCLFPFVNSVSLLIQGHRQTADNNRLFCFWKKVSAVIFEQRRGGELGGGWGGWGGAATPRLQKVV